MSADRRPDEHSVPAQVVAAYGLDPASLARAPGGLINRTWFATAAAAGRCVVQRVNPVFPPATQSNIDAVTRHLASQGLVTPRLIRTLGGELWVDADGGTWRALTFVHGRSFDSIARAGQALEAGRVLGRFHVALSDLEHAFGGARAYAHDTDHHLEALRRAVREGAAHRHFSRIDALAAEVLELAADIETLPTLPDRVVHGDPKISNVLFDAAGAKGVCLIDLDTVARTPVVFELGDALRSWCNSALEDAPEPQFSLELCAAALEGYVAGSAGLLGPDEWHAVAGAPYRIAVELAARFCRDALTESYFGWDDARYAGASEHNQARTRSQLDLARNLAARRAAVRSAVERAFTRR